MTIYKVRPTDDRFHSEWHVEIDGRVIRSPLILVAPDGRKVPLNGRTSGVPWNKVREAFMNEASLHPKLELASGDKIIDEKNMTLFEFDGREFVLNPQLR